MNTKQILRYAFFGALVYGAYKLGEKNAKDDVESEDKLAKGSPEPVEQTEADYIDFEVAIIDENTRDFVTKYYVPEANDDVLGYQDSSQVEHIANLLFKKDFQVK